MKLWHDDARKPPGDWVRWTRSLLPPANAWIWVRTNAEAMAALCRWTFFEMSMDHDLGLDHLDPDDPMADFLAGPIQGKGAGVDLARWMVTEGHMPREIRIHSMNPVGAQNMVREFHDWNGPHVTLRIERFDPAERA